MPSRGPLLGGLLLVVVAVALVLVGAGLRGPLNPACAGRPYAAECFQALPVALTWAALPIAIAGAVLIAMWLARRAAEDHEVR